MIPGKKTQITLALPKPESISRTVVAGRSVVLAVSLMMLSACTAQVGGIGEEPSHFLQELPEGVMAIAAPYQNLRAVILQPEDGCYWYEHVGPVETTMLPLRTAEGRPICTATENRPATTG
ncbi:MAG: hypothetical protein NW217_08240 [Hyphomicrobiaceae bacterium]|nr:hypothetical protein [Hyphomicrobiaceae bacterium]